MLLNIHNYTQHPPFKVRLGLAIVLKEHMKMDTVMVPLSKVLHLHCFSIYPAV
uniref:Uncharacterized protein n=1 Tax=Anguilla anguilla TaxID=7936 RepID=A0A0E9W2E3_ANGAN